MNRSVREGKSVKSSERSNGLDIALYKSYINLLFTFAEIEMTEGLSVSPRRLQELRDAKPSNCVL